MVARGVGGGRVPARFEPKEKVRGRRKRPNPTSSSTPAPTNADGLFLGGCVLDTKRGGWGWHQIKMVDPQRAERLWLAMAVATLWAVSVGGEVDANLPVSSLEALPQTHVARHKATTRSRPRMLSCFARGIVTIVGKLIRGDGLVVGRFVPEPWPTSLPGRKKKNNKTKTQAAQQAA